MVQYGKEYIRLNLHTAHNSGHTATLRSAQIGLSQLLSSANRYLKF